MQNIIKFNHPASVWEEALPLGNGSFGAMVWGGYASQKLSLNLDTFWSGTVCNDTAQNRVQEVQKQRELIFNRDFVNAEKHAAAHLTYPKNGAYYLPLGDVTVEAIGRLNTTKCRMELNMQQAAVAEQYTYRESPWTTKQDKQKRRTFISQPHNVLVSEILSDVPTCFHISFKSYFTHEISNSENGLKVLLTAPLSVDGGKEIVYGEGTVSAALLLYADTDGDVVCQGGQLFINAATTIKIYVAAQTNFVNYNTVPDKNMDLIGVCQQRIDKALQDGVEQVFAKHLEYHQSFYNRMSVDLPETEAVEAQYTDELRKLYQKGIKSNRLVELMFNYGRYLLICCSAPGTQAANLQGIWNDKPFAAWNGGYTTNINLQMNYWLAETANLSEFHLPLMDLIADLSVAGEQTAKDFYGCNGFVTHHNVDIWRKCSPVPGGPWYSVWPMGSGWLCQHLYTHYLYTGDSDFLKNTAYPVTQKAARFYLDFLCENKKGELVTCPSTSPENRYVYQGEVCAVTEMSAMDRQIVQEVFENTLKMAEILGDASPVLSEIRTALPKLAPLKIGSKGQLLEWSEEFTETEDGHRHLSHLYGVFPGNNLMQDKNLYNAARKALQMRMDNGSGATGWSCGWIILLLATFGEGENAKQYIDKLIQDSTYPNLFDAHPPFQIDGNFAFTAAVLHMVLQSKFEKDEIVLDILPALPKEWNKGEIKGICTAGGIVADVAWNETQVHLHLASQNNDKKVCVRYMGKETQLTVNGTANVTLINKEREMCAV